MPSQQRAGDGTQSAVQPDQYERRRPRALPVAFSVCQRVLSDFDCASFFYAEPVLFHTDQIRLFSFLTTKTEKFIIAVHYNTGLI